MLIREKIKNETLPGREQEQVQVQVQGQEPVMLPLLVACQYYMNASEVVRRD
jgi:hypothetical protein